MNTLYNKWRWLRALNSKPKAVSKTSNSGGKSENNQNVKDLRKSTGGPDKSNAVVNKDSNPADSSKGNTKNTAGGNKSGANGKTDSTTTANNNKSTIDNQTASLSAAFPNVNLSKMSDDQIDSLLQVMKEQDRAKAAAEKAKKKADRKAARKLRRSKVPELNTVEKIAGHIITMVNRVTLNYTQTAGTILPGYLDSTRFMGVNNYSSAPGLGFVYGYQPNYSWLAAQAAAVVRFNFNTAFSDFLQDALVR